MLEPTDILTADGLRLAYGDFYHNSPFTHIDAEKVPSSLRALIPYAQFWGLPDDRERESLIKSASGEILQNMKAVVSRFEDSWEPWLIGPGADNPASSDEYVAFAALVMAADYV